MALDTNVKEFRYSIWTKIICIILAVVTFSTSAAMITRTVTSVIFANNHFNQNDDCKWTENYEFMNYFRNDVASVAELSSNEERNNVYLAALANKKKAVVDEAYKQYLLKKAEYDSLQTRSDENYNHYDDYETTTFEFTNDITVEIEDIPVSDASTVNEHFTVDFYSLKKTDDYGSGIETVEQAIGKYYDAFTKGKSVYDYTGYYYSWNGYDREHCINSLRYFTQKGNTVNSNITSAESDKNFDEQSYNNDSVVYFISRHGEMEYKGISQEQANELYENYINHNSYAMESDIYIYLVMPEDSQNLIRNPRYWNDIYINLYNFSDTAMKYSHNITQSVIIEAILMIIALVSGIYVLTIAGKRKDGTVKIAFIDKLPFVIHLTITAALICGAGTLYFHILDVIFSSAFSVLFIILTGLAAFVGWILLFELCASIARYVHSGRKIKNGFLTYKIGKLVLKLAEKTKQAFAYKPGTFKVKILIITALYFIANVLIIGFAFFSAAVLTGGASFVISTMIILADIAANVFIIIKVLTYIKNLDTIITAFSNHQEPDVNIDALPNSLKILAESMKYTNEELQNAVNKAIKDERLRSELITNVSHDLKTPLTSIITYVDLLSKCDIQDEKAKEYIGVLDDKGAKLKRLIDDLIEASKVTSGNVTVNLTSINLSELCMQSTVDAQADFEKAGLDLIVKDCEQPPIVTGDGAKTFRVIENLLSNARKYSAVSSRVYVNVYSENGYGIFEIKNISAQPLDISPDELTERFVRGDKSRNQEGNGLGLSIAKELCSLQNGRLELTIDGDLFKAKVKLPLA